LQVEFGETFGEGHADGLCGRVEREEEGAGEGDEELVARGGREDEEWCGGIEAARAVGGGGEVDGGDGAEGLVAVVDGAADQVGDVGCAVSQGCALGERDLELQSPRAARPVR